MLSIQVLVWSNSCETSIRLLAVAPLICSWWEGDQGAELIPPLLLCTFRACYGSVQSWIKAIICTAVYFFYEYIFHTILYVWYILKNLAAPAHSRGPRKELEVSMADFIPYLICVEMVLWIGAIAPNRLLKAEQIHSQKWICIFTNMYSRFCQLALVKNAKPGLKKTCVKDLTVRNTHWLGRQVQLQPVSIANSAIQCMSTKK